MIAFGQAFSAAVVSRDCSFPEVHFGRPLTLTAPFLSVSRITSFSAGGCEPSLVSIFPDALRVIGASFFFGSLVGLNPPLKVNLRLPASTVTGFSAPVASPATLTAIRAARAIVNIKYLRISLYLSFAACPSTGPMPSEQFQRLSSGSNYHPRLLRKPARPRKGALARSGAWRAALAPAPPWPPPPRGRAASPRTSGREGGWAGARSRRG